MFEVINSLAKIEFSRDVLQQLDMEGIYRDFSSIYGQLDNLKNFRADHENKNRFLQWWDNDKLADAQLDSAEVQAKFSKMIGQLMMISIAQSKGLMEQQGQLNNQQSKLESQANGIAAQASQLQIQHHTLDEQSKDLKNLMHDYFEMKGLTEDGAQRLIDIASEVKATKAGLLEEFVARELNLRALCSTVESQTDSLAVQLGSQISQIDKTTQLRSIALEDEMRKTLSTIGSDLRKEQLAEQQVNSQLLEKSRQDRIQIEALQGKVDRHVKVISYTVGGVTVIVFVLLIVTLKLFYSL